MVLLTIITCDVPTVQRACITHLAAFRSCSRSSSLFLGSVCQLNLMGLRMRQAGVAAHEWLPEGSGLRAGCS